MTTARGVSKVRKSLQKVYEELNAEEFIYIDRGCIVNMIHIMQIRHGMAVLKNGESLPVSRSHLQEVKEEINDYWGGIYDGMADTVFGYGVCSRPGTGVLSDYAQSGGR